MKFSNCEEVKSTEVFGLCIGTVFEKKQPFHWQKIIRFFCQEGIQIEYLFSKIDLE